MTVAQKAANGRHWRRDAGEGRRTAPHQRLHMGGVPSASDRVEMPNCSEPIGPHCAKVVAEQHQGRSSPAPAPGAGYLAGHAVFDLVDVLAASGEGAAGAAQLAQAGVEVVAVQTLGPV